MTEAVPSKELVKISEYLGLMCYSTFQTNGRFHHLDRYFSYKEACLRLQ